MTDIWQLHSIEIVPKSGGVANAPYDAGNTFISALDNVSFPTNGNVTRKVPSGNIFATQGRIDFTSVDLSFSSTMAKVMIDALGIRGACFNNTLDDGDTINLYVARYDCDAPFVGAVHRRFVLSKGIILPTSITCQHRGDLTVSGLIKAVFDSAGNDPVTFVDDVALPAQSLLAGQDDAWTLHDGVKTQVNGQGVSGKQSVNIDFGVGTRTRGADSNTFDSYAGVKEVLPTITISGDNIEWFNQVGLALKGTPVTHANTRIPFRKRDGAGGFVADATSEHIALTANGPAHFSDLFSGSAGEPGSITMKIDGIQDSSGNAPIVFNTGVAA